MNLQDAIREVCLHKPFDAPYPVPVHQEAITRTHLCQKEVEETIRFTDFLIDRHYFYRNDAWSAPMREVFEEMRHFAADHKIVFCTPSAPKKNLKQMDLLDLYRDLSVTHSSITNNRDFYSLDVVLSEPVPKGKISFEPMIVDTPFGEDLPIHGVEFINGSQYLTLRRGKHRRGQSESFQFEAIMDTRVGTVHDVGDQDMPDALGAENVYRERADGVSPRFTFRHVIRSILDENDLDQDLREVKELPPPDTDDQKG